MAKIPTVSSRTRKPRWWEAIPEKVAVAVATAIVTGLIAVAGPPLKDWLYATWNNTGGATQGETLFQQAKWLSNPSCAGSQALWHEAAGSKQIDATICPKTGDILIVMRDGNGRQFQWWPNLAGLTKQFDSVEESKSQIGSLLIGSAFAQSLFSEKTPKSTSLTQAVMCQILLPDGRGLRRRIVVGPNSCIEVIIDSWTGMVVSQRPIPCVPNCMVNV